MTDYTLEQRLAYAQQQRALAQNAIDSANSQRQSAREMGGGILGFGGSGPQRAAQQVRSATDRAIRASIAAEERFTLWDQKVRSYERQIGERDRVRFTRADLVGATHVRTDTGWRKVARLNASTVSVETGYSWVDRIPFEKILERREIAQ
jgi:hypothetical protein